LFSTTFRYALICLLELAESKETLQASRIAGKFHLSPHYLSVVLRELRRLGLIESQKGNRGGYRLLQSAERINLLALHRSLAGSPTAEGWVEPRNGGGPPQGTADRWLQGVAQRWAAELAATTLADLRPGAGARRPESASQPR
jgi:Rrf2 family protein